MNSTGTLLRIVGAAILLIAVQLAPVAAEAHAGHGHGPAGHHLQGHAHPGLSHQGPDAAIAVGHSIAAGETAPAPLVTPAQPAAGDAGVFVQNAPDAPPSVSDACVMGCCGYTGCCGAALAVVSPSLPPQACSLRVGFARAISAPGVDPRGLRKPPRLPA